MPRATPLAKNCTLAMVAGAMAVAVAVSAAVELTASEAPVSGAVTAVAGALPPVTVTVFVAEVVVAPRLSVATAVTA